MSQTSKITLGIAIVAVILIAAFYFWQTAHAPSAPTAANPETTALPSGSNTSDAAIEQDLAAIDTQISSVSQDNAAANTSVDAAVSQ